MYILKSQLLQHTLKNNRRYTKFKKNNVRECDPVYLTNIKQYTKIQAALNTSWQ